jgi:hypothetical protein
VPIQLELAIKSKTSDNLSTLVKILGKNSFLTEKNIHKYEPHLTVSAAKMVSLPRVGRTHRISKEPIKPKTVPKT